MNTPRIRIRGPLSAVTALGTLLVLWSAPGTAVRGDDLIDWTRDPVLPSTLDLSGGSGTAAADRRDNRIHLFRIQPGFQTNPLGLGDQDEPAVPPDDPAAPRFDSTSGWDWVQVWMGNDNPFFDLRRPGDPGGVGFYKVHTQVQLFDTRTTGCAFAVQAVTPAGREFDGVDDGDTVFTPALSVFHTLDDGTALQGFVGKNLNVNDRWTSRLHHSMQYGMAVQRPLFAPGPADSGNLYVFVETLGRYRYDPTPGPGPLNVWEVLPGLQWRLNENMWMSGGMVVPVNTRPDANHWQITCSFHF